MKMKQKDSIFEAKQILTRHQIYHLSLRLSHHKDCKQFISVVNKLYQLHFLTQVDCEKYPLPANIVQGKSQTYTVTLQDK